MQLRSGCSSKPTLVATDKPTLVATDKPTLVAKGKVVTSSRRRSPRNYKKIDYTGMDTIEPESKYDAVYHDPDWLPTNNATDKPDNDLVLIKVRRMRLRSGRVLTNDITVSCTALRDKIKTAYPPATFLVRPPAAAAFLVPAPAPAPLSPEKDSTGVIQILKNYLKIFQEVKNKYYASKDSNRHKSKLYYVEMMRVIIEMYSIMNENFNTLASRSRDFLIVSRDKSYEFKGVFRGLDHKLRFRGRDLSLYRNCIRELDSYIGQVTMHFPQDLRR